jgi:hypothetical protein
MSLTKEQVENRKKWVQALRSGKYRQGSGTLRRWVDGTETAYCCLGVACDVLDPNGWTDLSTHKFGAGYLDEEGVERLGLSIGLTEAAAAQGAFTLPQDVLVSLNDEGMFKRGNHAYTVKGVVDAETGLMQPFTFDEIADIIELDTMMTLDGAL